MKKIKIVAAIALMIMSGGSIYAQQSSFHILQTNRAIPSGISPNGKLIVGSYSSASSFIWDAATNNLTFIPERNNMLNDISNSGIAVGEAVDTSLHSSSQPGAEILSGVIYRNNDWYYTGFAGYNFGNNVNAGSKIKAISSSRNLAAGVVNTYTSGDFREHYQAVIWNVNDISDYTLLPNPSVSEISGAWVNDISEDGNIVTGSFSNQPAIWKNGNEPIIIGENLEWVNEIQGEMKNVSPNGKYATGRAHYFGTDTVTHPALIWYNETETWEPIVEGTKTFAASAVSDFGEVIGFSMILVLPTSPRTSFYWTRETGIIPLEDHLRSKGVPVPEGTQLGTPMVMSADGRTMAGYMNMSDGRNVWVAIIGSDMEVASTRPEHNATLVLLNEEVRVTFNNTITHGDLSAITFTPNPGNISASVQGPVLHIQHNDFTPNTHYTVRIPASTIYGYDEDIVFSFTTGSSTDIPYYGMENEIHIYPNPSSGEVTVTVPENSVVRFFDVNGKLLREEGAINTTTLNFTQSPGTYIIQVIHNDRVSNHKLIIQ